jgi:Uma2 family endonuclease
MSPESYQTHGKVKSEVARVILNLNRARKLGEFFPDRTLLTNESVGLSTEPDGAFATRRSLKTRRARLIPRENRPDEYDELEGTPDWVLEVVSDSSVGKDTEWLMETYHRAGIPEYWLIDARQEKLSFQILLWRPAGYVPAKQQAGWQRSPVFGRSFRLKRKRNERDLWEYTLQVKKT